MSKSDDFVKFFNLYGPAPVYEGELSSALYTAAELHLFPDYIDGVSTEQAIMCWRIVDKLINVTLPDELRM